MMKHVYVFIAMLSLGAAISYGKDWETVFTLTPPEEVGGEYPPSAIVAPPFPLSATFSSTFLLGMAYSPSDLVIPNISAGIFATRSLSDPVFGISSFGFDPVTRSL